MAGNPQENIDRINAIVSAWAKAIEDQKMAVDKKFKGMTLADFKAKVKASLDTRATLAKLELDKVALIDQREDADVISAAAVLDVLKGVAGDEDYGDDCALYEQMGRKRISDYASGLTKKKAAAPEKK